MNEKRSPKAVAPAEAAPSLLRQRWFVPVVLAALALLAFGVLQWSKPSARKAAAPPDPQKTGRLVVKSNLAGAKIEVARIATGGEAPSASATALVDQQLSGLPPGKYTVTAQAEGWPNIRQDVNITAGNAAEITMHFPSGSLRLESDPAGATVRQGKTVLGKTPLTIPQLPPGACELSLEYTFWPAATFKTTITENTEATGTVRLPHGKLVLESTPSGATVRQGGSTLGQTPLTLERVPAGTNQFLMQNKDFPTLKVSLVVKDQAETKANIELGAGFPLLDPEELLQAVWVHDDPNEIAPPLDGTTGPAQPRNGIIKNLNRKRLYETWLRKTYRYSATIKAYEKDSGQVEFAEQTSALSRYRILAKLSPEARSNTELTARLTKGATFTLYGRLSAVEEPRWPAKIITFEFSSAEPLR